MPQAAEARRASEVFGSAAVRFRSANQRPAIMSQAFHRLQLSHRYLIVQLIKRDVLLRYRGAMFGLLWVLLNPLIMLAIYAFVFGHIFQARWPEQQTGAPFWLVLYSGLLAFNIFSETVSRAPAAVRSYPSFVKKIVFPVEILPLVPLGAALVHGVFNYLVLLAALVATGFFSPMALLYPLMLLPLLLLGLGLAWFLATWGVFIKDMSQIVPPFLQILMYLSPVLYPATAVPKFLRPVYDYNPLGTAIEACRAAALGQAIPWMGWSFSLLLGCVAAALGWLFFQYSREEFADAL